MQDGAALERCRHQALLESLASGGLGVLVKDGEESRKKARLAAVLGLLSHGLAGPSVASSPCQPAARCRRCNRGRDVLRALQPSSEGRRGSNGLLHSSAFDWKILKDPRSLQPSTDRLGPWGFIECNASSLTCTLGGLSSPSAKHLLQAQRCSEANRVIEGAPSPGIPMLEASGSAVGLLISQCTGPIEQTR